MTAYAVESTPNGYAVGEDGVTRMFNPTRIDGTGHYSAHDGDIIAPMPGKVIAVDVAQGQSGQPPASG